MPVYILLSNLTDEGWKTIKGKPERIKEVNTEIEKWGVQVKAQYAVLGPYDFVNIIEAPSDEIAAKVAIHLSARGGLQTLTLTAIPLDNLITTLKKKREPL